MNDELYTKVSLIFCNILLHATLLHVYHMTEAVQAVGVIHNGL